MSLRQSGGCHNNKEINSNNSLSSTSPKSGKRIKWNPLKKDYVPDDTETKLINAFITLIQPNPKRSLMTVENQAPTLWRILYGKGIGGCIDELRQIFLYFKNNSSELQYLPSFKQFELKTKDGSMYKYHFWLDKAETWEETKVNDEDEN